MDGEDVKPNINGGAAAGGNADADGAAATGADIKPDVNANTPIQLVVKDQSGGEVHFKVKQQTKFSKIFDAYCAKKNVEMNSFRFVFDGSRLNPDSTPQEHEMENDDTIEAFAEQVGGRR